jgi:hypothetical protein
MKGLLHFEDKQLPGGFDFNFLSTIFNSEKNLALIKKAGLEKPKEK